MIDLQNMTTAESADDFGREGVLALVDPRERSGVDNPQDQLDALIADELFTA